jgi:predicted TIM-barrel fold metal-dependent hydrolase
MTTLETANAAWRRFVIMPIDPVPGLLRDPSFRDGFRHLAPRNLTYDASVFHTQLDELGDLACDFPDTTIVLGRMGIAMALDLDEVARGEVFAQWRRGLRELAKRQNVVCKVGGLGMPFWGLGLEYREQPIGSVELASLWQPYVETAVETFGVGRCMMESNFPPDGRSCGYVPSWNALKQITGGCSDDEKLSLFRDTAARVYGIDVDASQHPSAHSPKDVL